uniref:Uncharacterized protein n=1 Tax=Arundo donax TaxID=35708 RepID=A0A0A9F6E3_ARUDO
MQNNKGRTRKEVPSSRRGSS